MQLRVIAVGKIRERYVAQACADFAARLAPYYPIEVVEVRASPGSRPAEAMAQEAARILKTVSAQDCMWLVDRAGRELSSDELSGMLGRAGVSGKRRISLVIAGTYGADATLQARADFVWSLSRLTFLHEWARMIVLEQLYRAAKIARNEPYHH